MEEESNPGYSNFSGDAENESEVSKIAENELEKEKGKLVFSRSNKQVHFRLCELLSANLIPALIVKVSTLGNRAKGL